MSQIIYPAATERQHVDLGRLSYCDNYKKILFIAWVRGAKIMLCYTY